MPGRPHSSLSRLLLPFVDFVYPPCCVVCGALRTDRSSKVCAGCWGRAARVTPEHAAWRELAARFAADRLVEEFAAAFLFENGGTFREIVHLLKYRGMRSIGVELGKSVGALIRSGGVDCCVPVPLHASKLRERGYNQSESIAGGIASVTGIPLRPELLRRTRATGSQTTRSPEERRRNVDGAFGVPHRAGKELDGKSVLIVDDVMTTGATVAACARALKESGAARVTAAAAAIAG